MDVDEAVAYGAQGPQGYGSAVDATSVAAGGGDDSGEDEGAVGVGLDAGFGSGLQGPGGCGGVEGGLYDGLVGAGADAVGGDTVPGGGAEGIDGYGLAGARLARDGCEAGPELQAELLDEGKLLDVKFREHPGFAAFLPGDLRTTDC